MHHIHQHGFTLIELLIAIAIAGILAAIAYPSFQAPLHKARRTDGVAALLQLQIRQEQWRSSHREYAPGLVELNADSHSDHRHYQLRVVGSDATSYSLHAVAIGPQASDRGCQTLRLEFDRGQVRHASGRDAGDTNAAADNKRCWGM